METFRLKSMTDFVLEQIKNFNAVVYDDLETASINLIERIENYANFQKQPLKLEMFVPSDEDGNVLEEPKIEEEYVDEHTTQIFAQYQYDLDKAKEKVLFELNSPVAVETMNYHISRNRNIEYLANFGSIKLTQNSLNSIFGKTVA